MRIIIGLYLKSIEFIGIPLGLMVTAGDTNNKVGFKLIGFDGQPIGENWINFFNEISNVENILEFISNYIIDMYENKKIIFDPFCKSAICFAFDIRPHSKVIYQEIM